MSIIVAVAEKGGGKVQGILDLRSGDVTSCPPNQVNDSKPNPVHLPSLKIQMLGKILKLHILT